MLAAQQPSNSMPDDTPKADQEALLRRLLEEQQQREIMLRTQGLSTTGGTTAAGATAAGLLHHHSYSNNSMSLNGLMLNPTALHLTSRAQLLQSLVAAEQREIQQRRLLLSLQGQFAGLPPTPTFAAPPQASGLLLQPPTPLPPASSSSAAGIPGNCGTANLSPEAMARSRLLVEQVARDYLQGPTTAAATSSNATASNSNPKKRSFEETQAFLLPRGSSAAPSSTLGSVSSAAAASKPPPKKRPATTKKKKAAATTDAGPPTERRKDTKWMAMLEILKAYKAEHGNCIVPRGYTPNPRLASWVAEQRKQYKLMTDGKPTSITPDRVAKLEELDFAWNAQEAAWKRHVDDLRAFKQDYGHCHVPLSDPNFPKLGLWVKEQRRHYTLMQQGRPSHMTEARAAELRELGFCWDTHEATWLDRLRQLKAYKKKYGDCLVPAHWQPNPKLGTWVTHQRRQYRKYRFGKESHITPERIDQLNEIGFHWDTRPMEEEDTSDVSSVASSSASSSTSASDNESASTSGGSLPPRKRHRLIK